MKSGFTLSYWEKVSFLHDIDIIIIGSGIVGLTAAIQLKEQDSRLNVLVLERGVLPLGASTRNAGFACFGSMTELMADYEKYGYDQVFALVEQRWRGLHRLRERLGEATIDFKMNGGYEIFTQNNHVAYAQCRERMGYFNDELFRIIGTPDTFVLADQKISENGLANVNHIIQNQFEGQLHTGKMMRRLLQIAQSKDVIILNGIEVTDIQSHNQGVTLLTNTGWTLDAHKVLVCTNGFARQLLPRIDVQSARNQVLITKPIPNLLLDGCFHYEEGYYYFRNIDNRILLGGGRHLAFATEAVDDFGTTELISNALDEILHTIILPNQHTEVDMRWSGILGLGHSKKPIVEMLTPHLGVAVRMGGMGVALGSLVGEDGANMLLS
ncbi:MAG: FAD-binding oxidoreductase [Saprospiraceae bacterium]|nr:FAD-binding oxidoreductase [Saprospiraceae bacterium]MBP7699461.1 FAD-binding oxidoreductase [Saprospiraceae bacterium]